LRPSLSSLCFSLRRGARPDLHSFPARRSSDLASRGIGLAIAERLAADGARVFITARKPEPLAEAAASFPEGSVLTVAGRADDPEDRKSTRLNSSHVKISYAVFCLKKKKVSHCT